MTTIKTLAYSAQQHLEANIGARYKRAHIYELLAASFGFNSYASFCAAAVFTEAPITSRPASSNTLLVQNRCIEIGYTPEAAKAVSVVLPGFLAEHGIGVIRIADLVAQQRGESEGYYAPEDEDDGQPIGSEYWHQQAQLGHVLSGATKEWADAYAENLARSEKYEYHLREASRLGHQDALLEDIAERLGQPHDERKWLTAAAQAGDSEAMRQLIEEHDCYDLQQCWTWMYLAKLVGVDLTEDEHQAIHENGDPYDDDVGGPIFVAGRNGIELAPIGAEAEAAARRAAQEMFHRLKLPSR